MDKRKSIRFSAAFDKYQVFIIPTFGFINESWYYGYPVFGVAFAWLWWRCKVQFGVKMWRKDNENTV